MNHLSATASNVKEANVWHSLKEAIASSSGFQSWQSEIVNTQSLNNDSLDIRVQRYLKETLETLAY